MILFRTQDFGNINRRFVEQMASCNGGRIACVVDETRTTIDTTPWPKISLTAASCRSLGLVAPFDVGWRCGDYGFHLARAQFPSEPSFWMIEHDVRFSGGGPAAFFDRFRNDQVTDLWAPQLRRTDRNWFWEHTVVARGLTAYRCLFPVIRLSARAIDYVRSKRQQLARHVLRRLAWPNDESFVATALMNHPDMICRDLNDAGATLYTDKTFSFEGPFDGDTLDMTGRDSNEALMIYHPVLFGKHYQAKLERLRAPQSDRLLYRRVLRRLVRAINMRTAW
jgi:hypothetical protein